MEQIKLIANSGIQFYKFDLAIDANADVMGAISFYEWLDTSGRGEIRLEYAKYLPEDEIYVREQQLLEDGWYDEDGSLSENLDISLLQKLDEETDVFRINDITSALEELEEEWLPLPFFEINNAGYPQFGPTNWCRIKLIPLGSSRNVKKYRAVLAFDTKTSSENFAEAPSFSAHGEGIKSFGLCEDLNLIKDFTNPNHNCGWVKECLEDVVFGGGDKVPYDEFPTLKKHIGNYIYFVKYLSELKILPSIELCSDSEGKFIDVDLVLDIGNANTCGILLESPQNKSNFKFDKVTKLKLQDLSNPLHEYEDSFSTRLAFHKCKFGKIEKDRFQWPSFVRVGKEAKRLIYEAANISSVTSDMHFTNYSSPKRYLWDDEVSDIQWELIRTDPEQTGKHITVDGISEQFRKDGSLASPEDINSSTIFNNYSRKSLMTFVFVELFNHALIQINSHPFRKKHGNEDVPRRLRRVVITCPTAMVQEEQVALRRCAEEASIALGRYFSSLDGLEFDSEKSKYSFQVIPSVKDLKKDLTLLDTRKYWMYDEATCCQFVFLYAEISKRYLNKNCDKYFELYGKKRNDLYGYDKKSITIGSLDIGGGTTDLMICSYKYNDSGTTVLTPVPLYWESFNTAGDNLLKEIIKQVVLEGEITEKNEQYTGAVGVIENYAKQRGIVNARQKINTFFGTDSANFSAESKQMRKEFNTQIAIPVAEKYLAHTSSGKSDETVSFDEIFSDYKPSKTLLDYFEKHFGFRFEEIKWRMCADRINDIVIEVFEKLILQISVLLYAKGCDFVLLAGKPTSLDVIGDLFLKYYSVSPDKIINLNTYRVGRWYPFQNASGYFTDQKSLVAVGASIALMGGELGKLQDFQLNMETLKKKLISTAEYIGVYDRSIKSLDTVIVSPDFNKSKFEVGGLPILLGFRRLSTSTYPSRLIYTLDFDKDRIREKRQSRLDSNDLELVERDVEDYIKRLKSRTPFVFNIIREYRDSREKLTIDSVMDSTRESLPKSIFKLKLKTLDDESAYWMDTGEFVLKIESR